MMVKHCTKKQTNLFTKKNKKIKTSLLMMIQIGIPPVFGGPCPLVMFSEMEIKELEQFFNY